MSNLVVLGQTVWELVEVTQYISMRWDPTPCDGGVPDLLKHMFFPHVIPRRMLSF